MKFEFCGKLDCPDWILTQLFHASHLDLSRFRMICEGVKDNILNDGHFDDRLFENLNLEDIGLDLDDARACFGATNYIISNSRRHKVPGDTLAFELEQLGLPKEHCKIVCDIVTSI